MISLGSSTNRKGFTLVELLIVVIILAILAAIIVPQFSAATDDAKQSAYDTNVANIRAAIDLYRQQHNAYPGAVAATAATCPDGVNVHGTVGADSFDAQLRNYTNAAGQACTGTDSTFKYGPYLKDPLPANPLGDPGSQHGNGCHDRHARFGEHGHDRRLDLRLQDRRVRRRPLVPTADNGDIPGLAFQYVKSGMSPFSWMEATPMQSRREQGFTLTELLVVIDSWRSSRRSRSRISPRTTRRSSTLPPPTSSAQFVSRTASPYARASAMASLPTRAIREFVCTASIRRSTPQHFDTTTTTR